ncbi:MAG: type II secretion system protein GspC [Pseudomonadota bacterium]
MAQTLRFDGELGSRLLALLPRPVAYVLVVLVGVRFAFLLLDLTLPPATEIPDSVTPATPVRNVVDVPSILRANLFGQAAPAAGADAPVTSMRLVLAGVVASPDEKQGMAMIGTAPNTIELKKVGDPLPGGAKLHAVHVDRVLLDRGGTIESLPLPELATISFAPPPPPANTAAVTVQRVEQAIRGNPSLIGQIMHRTPVIVDGRLRGIRVTAGPNAAAFARLGLRNNDLVTAINGVELNDEARSRDVFDSLSGAAEARVTVERNGVPQELVLNLAEIASEAEQLVAQPGPENPAGEQPGPDAESAR